MEDIEKYNRSSVTANMKHLKRLKELADKLGVGIEEALDAALTSGIEALGKLETGGAKQMVDFDIITVAIADMAQEWDANFFAGIDAAAIFTALGYVESMGSDKAYDCAKDTALANLKRLLGEIGMKRLEGCTQKEEVIQLLSPFDIQSVEFLAAIGEVWAASLLGSYIWPKKELAEKEQEE